MAGVRFPAPARVSGTGVPLIGMYELASAQTFKRGAFVYLDTDGLLATCGSDPTTILGVALAAANTVPGKDAANSPTEVTGLLNRVSVAIANDATVFSMRGVNGGTDPLTPTQTMVGESYGSAVDGNGVWYLDQAESSTKSLLIVDVDITNKIFFCKFLSAVQQFSA
jgi:hypothetical protein